MASMKETMTPMESRAVRTRVSISLKHRSARARFLSLPDGNNTSVPNHSAQLAAINRNRNRNRNTVTCTKPNDQEKSTKLVG